MIAVQILEQPPATMPAVGVRPDIALGHDVQDEAGFADDLFRLLREIDSLSVGALSGRSLAT